MSESQSGSADWRAEIERVQAVADDIRSRSKLDKDEAFTLTLLDLIIERSQLRRALEQTTHA